MIFTVLDIQFTKDQLRKLIAMTDTNKDGKIDTAEFHRMLYEEDIAKMAEVEDEDIEIVEEASNESDNEEAEMVAQVRAGMIANRERVMSAKQEQQKQAAAMPAAESKAKASMPAAKQKAASSTAAPIIEEED